MSLPYMCLFPRNPDPCILWIRIKVRARDVGHLRSCEVEVGRLEHNVILSHVQHTPIEAHQHTLVNGSSSQRANMCHLVFIKAMKISENDIMPFRS
jgi:hypothetical protein